MLICLVVIQLQLQREKKKKFYFEHLDLFQNNVPRLAHFKNWLTDMTLFQIQRAARKLTSLLAQYQKYLWLQNFILNI